MQCASGALVYFVNTVGHMDDDRDRVRIVVITVTEDGSAHIFRFDVGCFALQCICLSRIARIAKCADILDLRHLVASLS